ncbi:MAG: tRNA dihydrouridine synthase DusB [bacterium]|nr:tRNA dihydrouridine synthase DusB [bacterium]
MTGMVRPVQIGRVTINPNLFVAPMAGYTDLPYRRIVRELGGAGLVYTELISCHALVRLRRKTELLIATTPDEHPLAMQIFGSDPERMAASASVLEEYGADIIDINMGCPVAKVVKTGGGAVLMREPVVAEAIVRACVRAVSVPVTVKIRAGWDERSRNAVEFARRMADAGAAAIAVHARTRAQGYSGRADWGLIAEVVQAVPVPVIGNGDVVDGPSARALLEQTGCAGVMIGRAAVGAPWLFRAVEQYLATGEEVADPGPRERGELALRHFRYLCELYGERTACLHIRRIACGYARGLPGAREFRTRVVQVASAAEVRAVIEEFFWLSGRSDGSDLLDRSEVTELSDSSDGKVLGGAYA